MSHDDAATRNDDLPPDAAKAPGAAGVAGPIVARLNELLRDRTFADIARATSCNSETVRRYMRGGLPSVAFVVAVARHYRVSLDWLLLGEEPRHDRLGPPVGGASSRRADGDDDGHARGGSESDLDGDDRDVYRPIVRGVTPGGALREGA